MEQKRSRLRSILGILLIVELVAAIVVLVRYSSTPDEVVNLLDPVLGPAPLTEATATAFAELAALPSPTPDQRPPHAPVPAAALLKQALALQQQGPAAMEAALRGAVEADPTFAEARLALAGVLGEEGKLDEAETAAQEALDLIDQVGLANPSAGNSARASAHLTLAAVALQRAQDAAKGVDNQGVVAAFRQAEAEFHLVLRFDPGLQGVPEFRTNLDKLRPLMKQLETLLGS